MQPEKQSPQETPQPNSAAMDEKTRKARMLISLLGADFTRSASHPFFKRLSQTAIGTSGQVETEGQTDISGALSDLLSALKDTETAAPRSKHAPPKPTPPTPAPAPAPSQPAPGAKRSDPSFEADTTPDMLRTQHPAIIARELQSMPQDKKTNLIKTLSGKLARQVALYSKELDRR